MAAPTRLPAVFEHLVIFHCVTANWGTNGPARDRFYAFDKTSGELVWYSTPGIRPVDSAFNTPVSPALVEDRIYSTTAIGELLCIDLESGKTLWRKKLAPDQLHASLAAPDSKLSATTRGRVIASRGYREGIDDIKLVMDGPDGQKINFLPLP